MSGLDERVAHLGTGGSVAVALVVAVLLGLRHATDPDHLTALATLVASERGDGARRASRLGLAWGAGHATTLLLAGLPVVLLQRFLPDGVQRGAEAAVGLVVAGLAVRLLTRWRRGLLHAHPHRHAGVVHAHPHVHAERGTADGHDHPHLHEHAHAEQLGRSSASAFGIGLLHGLGGSAGVGVLLIGAMPDHRVAALALVLFALATAASMALLSGAWGRLLAAGRLAPRLAVLIPSLGVAGLAFGLSYAVIAVV